MRNHKFVTFTSILAMGVTALAACHGASTPAPASANPATGTAATPAAGKTMTLEEAGVDGKAMDMAAKPCDDFYQYACGGWLKSFELPADKSRWTKSFSGIDDANQDTLRAILEGAAKDPGNDPVKKKIGDYYAACTDEKAVDAAGATPLKPYRDEIAKVKNVKTLAPVLGDLHRVGAYAFFAIGSDQDRDDATKVIAEVDQAGLGLPDRDYYLKDDAHTKEIRDFYAAHVERMFKLLGEKDPAAKTASADVMRIETQLAKLAQSRVERRDPKATWHKIGFDGLKKDATHFPWDAYLKATKHDGVKSAAWNVSSPDYFKGVDALMAKEKPAAIRNYLTWALVRSHAMTLSKPFVDEQFAMGQKLSGVKALEPRWKRCVRATNGALGELLAQAYVEQKFAGTSKPLATAIVKGIAASMKSNLSTLDWMDDSTRTGGFAKVDKMAFQIGYPDKWRAYDFDVKRNAYAKAAMASDAWDFDYDMDYIGKPVDKGRWGMTPPTVNAYYNPAENQMVFPAGILQPPFFEKSRLSAVNYGAIGSVMGHELTHGFDDEGAQFDADGNLKDWWSKDTEAKFKQKTGCIAKQYGAFEPIPGEHLNGELTTGENIADIGGLKMAWEAWKAERAKEGAPAVTAGGLTEDQLFFVSFAQGWCEKVRPEYAAMAIKVDPHSPGRFRVLGTLADTPPFFQAFGCKKEPACQVW